MNRSDYKAWQAFALKTSRYFIFVEHYLDIMSHRAAVVLQMLVNLPDQDDGWNLCTVEFLEAKGRVDRHGQDIVLKELIGLGIIEVKRRGQPGRRHVRVLLDVLCEKLKPFITCKPPSGGNASQSTGKAVDSDSSQPEKRLTGKAGIQSTGKAVEYTYKKRQDDKQQLPPTADAAAGGCVAADTINCREATRGKQPCVAPTADKPEAAAIPDKSSKSNHTITCNAPTADNHDRVNAVRLHDILTRHGKLKGKRRVDVSQWAKDFSRLRRDDVTQDELNGVLDWYDTYLHLKHCPKCYAANTFCEKYARVKDAMRRQQEDAAAPPIPNKAPVIPLAELTADEKKILEWAKDSFDWKATTIGLLPNLIAATYRSYDEFNLRCHKLMKRLDENDRLYHMARKVVSNWGLPADYVRDWLEHIHDKNAGWKEWSGHVKPCVVGSEQFNQEGTDVSLDYSGHERTWGELLKELGYES